MSIQSLRIDRCRILSHLEIEPSESFNLITGPNGSGKSSFLEAVSLLGTGRSFRSSSVSPVVQEGSSSLIVSAKIRTATGGILSVGMERGKQIQRLQINHSPVQRLSEFAEHLPLQIITPESIDLVMGPPKGRRSFIDWGMFHVEPQFLSLSKRYKKILRHRNALLKRNTNSREEISHWDNLLIESGEALTQQRDRYLADLFKVFNENILQKIPLLKALHIEMRYRQGWKESLSLRQALEQSHERERVVGHTVVGPQEADLQLITNGERAKQILSRGQAKLFSMGLYLAQLLHLEMRSGKQGVVLIDDLFSELDYHNSLTIFDHLIESGYQVFATTADEVSELSQKYSVKRFHVEQGEMKEYEQ